MKRIRMIGGHLMEKDIDKKSNPFSVEVKGGENVERERIFPSMKKGEIVGQSCH